MADISRPSVRVSTPAGHRRGAATHTDKLRSRRYAGDFSHLPPVGLENDLSPLPDYNKDLPHIPSTLMGFSDAEAVTLFTSLSGNLTTSPIPRSPHPLPSHDIYERVKLTEAQEIAARYRQRHCSRSSAALSSSTVIQSGVYPDGQDTGAAIRVSLAPRSPPIRRVLAEETEITPEVASRFGRFQDNGAVWCSWEDCLEILPSLVAFLSHLRVHLVDEGYVARLRRASFGSGALIILC